MKKNMGNQSLHSTIGKNLRGLFIYHLANILVGVFLVVIPLSGLVIPKFIFIIGVCDLIIWGFLLFFGVHGSLLKVAKLQDEEEKRSNGDNHE